MKKTININLAKIAFIIDEDAYKKLDNYLRSIEKHFSNSEIRKEIMEDIEARIAELLLLRITDSHKVVGLEDIEHVVEVMGEPEAYAENEEAEESNTKSNRESSDEENFEDLNEKWYQRKIYRDPEGRVIGGVCAGLEHYLGFNKVWIRILFVILLIVTKGIAIPLYIILWVVIPEARTTAQKLAMKGKKVDYSTIGKAVKEELETASKSFERFWKKNKYGQEFSRPSDPALKGIATAVRVIVGLVFLIIGFSAMIPMISTLFGNTILSIDGDGIHSMDKSMFNMLLDQQFGHYLWIGLSLVLFSIVTFFISGGIKMVFDIRRNVGWIMGMGVMGFFVGLALICLPALNALKDFTIEKSSSVEMNVPITDSILTLHSSDIYALDYKTIFNEDNVHVMKDDSNIHLGYPVLNIKSVSADSVAKIIVKKYSRGSSRTNALNRASKISYDPIIENGKVLLPPSYSFTGEWRVQEVEITLYVPENIKVAQDEFVNEFRTESIRKHVDIKINVD